MKENSTSIDVELVQKISYEDLLLELKAYISILDYLANVVSHDSNIDLSLIHYILSKKLDIIYDYLQKYI